MLLSIALTSRFASLSSFGRGLYIVTGVLGASSTAALITPVSLHRCPSGLRAPSPSGTALPVREDRVGEVVFPGMIGLARGAEDSAPCPGHDAVRTAASRPRAATSWALPSASR
ncbi:DUF6328 family protein [Streptomyces virginiae]|uniref:DUF6328 family protein n=1 Tax=Streptomyces virginiae TaxID=1961 RepID=UPI002DBAB32C|nr:DUF6328 family protein [Streptomyces sp. CMAA1738]MEC4575777.1 DUF6328 family protein [Streptomyces sp. CMAA1738]